MRCALYACNEVNQSKGCRRRIKFFSFPKDNKIRSVWIRSCQHKDTFNAIKTTICSRHFNEGDNTTIICSEKAKLLFFRSRMYFRIKSLNRDLHNETVHRKRT